MAGSSSRRTTPQRARPRFSPCAIAGACSLVATALAQPAPTSDAGPTSERGVRSGVGVTDHGTTRRTGPRVLTLQQAPPGDRRGGELRREEWPRSTARWLEGRYVERRAAAFPHLGLNASAGRRTTTPASRTSSRTHPRGSFSHSSRSRQDVRLGQVHAEPGALPPGGRVGRGDPRRQVGRSPPATTSSGASTSRPARCDGGFLRRAAREGVRGDPRRQTVEQRATGILDETRGNGTRSALQPTTTSSRLRSRWPTLGPTPSAPPTPCARPAKAALPACPRRIDGGRHRRCSRPRWRRHRATKERLLAGRFPAAPAGACDERPHPGPRPDGARQEYETGALRRPAALDPPGRVTASKNVEVFDQSSRGKTWNLGLVTLVSGFFDGLKTRAKVAQAEATSGRPSSPRSSFRDGIALEVRLAVDQAAKSAEIGAGPLEHGGPGGKAP